MNILQQGVADRLEPDMEANDSNAMNSVLQQHEDQLNRLNEKRDINKRNQQNAIQERLEARRRKRTR